MIKFEFLLAETNPTLGIIFAYMSVNVRVCSMLTHLKVLEWHPWYTRKGIMTILINICSPQQIFNVQPEKECLVIAV